MNNLLKKDYWHDEFSVTLVTIGWFMTAVWAFMTKNPAMMSFLHFFTPWWVILVAGFGGKRLVEVLKLKDQK